MGRASRADRSGPVSAQPGGHRMKHTSRATAMCALVVGLVLLACSPPARPAGQASGQQPTAGEPIRIGAVVPLQGRYAALGAQVRPGYEIAVEDINAAGGIEIGGVRRPLELKILDDES